MTASSGSVMAVRFITVLRSKKQIKIDLELLRLCRRNLYANLFFAFEISRFF